MRTLSPNIQRPHGKGLGDCWSVINYFISLGLEKDETMRLSRWYPKGESIKRADKLTEMLPLFENNDIIQLGEWEPTVPKIHWTCGHAYPPVPTKIKWKPNCSKQICYQFDGKSKPAARFPSKEIEEKIFGHVKGQGYNVVPVGGGTTLEECVKMISECELFLGIDSGMCYLAAAVGIPIMFCRNNRPPIVWESTNHSNKHFILAEDYVALIDNISEYCRGGLDYYIQNAQNVGGFTEK